MIKDSKLIGTKIDAPYGWKKFKVGELFDCKNIKQIPTGLDLDSVGDIPYVSQTSINNSITHYITEKSCLELNKGNAIVLGVDTQWATYQEFDFYANKMISLYLKSSFSRLLTSSVGLYMCSVLNKNFTIYDYNRKLSFHKLVSTAIDLPVTSNSQPDFEWMSAYIKVVKQDYLEQKKLSNQREIKDYLTAGNVDSMDVTDVDRQFLRDFEKLPRRKFKIGELFDHVVQGERLKRSDHISGNVPFIMAGTTNTGISDYISNSVKHFPSNSITIDIFGNAFYRDYEYGMGDDTGAYWSESSCISKLTMLFIVTVLNKSLTGTYSYGHKLRSSRAVDLSITLPICAVSDVDVQSIEKYMQIQVKLTIAKRKSYLDHELELMKPLCQ